MGGISGAWVEFSYLHYIKRNDYCRYSLQLYYINHDRSEHYPYGKGNSAEKVAHFLLET